MIAENTFDIDTYVKQPSPSIVARAKTVVLNWMNVGSHKVSQVAVPPRSQSRPLCQS